MAISQKIQELRKKEGLSQEQFAEMFDVSRQSVSKWESGQSMPDMDKIMMISERFSVTTDYLLKEENGAVIEDSVLPAAETPAQPKKKKRLRVLLIAAGVLSFLLIVLTIEELFRNDILFLTSTDRMDHYIECAFLEIKNDWYNDTYQKKATEYYKKKFAGTKVQAKAIESMKENMEEVFWVNPDKVSELFGEPEVLPRLSAFIDTLNTEDEVLLKAREGLERANLSVTINHIHANRDIYNGKKVLVWGWLVNHNPSTKIIVLTRSGREENDLLPIAYGIGSYKPEGFEWRDLADYQHVIVYGTMFSYDSKGGLAMAPEKFLVLDSQAADSILPILQTIADWGIVDPEKQTAQPIDLSGPYPASYPQDLLPLFQMDRIVKSNETDTGPLLSYLTTGSYAKAKSFYHNLLLDLGGKYTLQNLSSNMVGLTTLLPNSEKSVYVLICNGAIPEGENLKKIDQVSVTVIIGPKSAYYETDGTMITR